MRIDNSTRGVKSEDNEKIVALVLREAKKLHRAAVSDSLAESLPVLRRLLSAKAIPEMPLPELRQRRDFLQRKHVLRLLALEAGCSSWEEYRAVLSTGSPEQFDQFDILKRAAGYPNVWFSSLKEAELHVSEHGGRAVRFGQQAVVFVNENNQFNLG